MSVLRPSQSHVGVRQVQAKAAELRKKSTADQAKYLVKKAAPVVLGPGKGLHLLDRHHLSRSALEIGFQEMPVEIQQDWSHLAPSEFWKKMTQSQWVYLKDAKGQAITVADLPKLITQMTDDPYRSLAGAVQDADGFDKPTGVYFIEFQWALFFRKHLPNVDLATDSGFNSAVQTALKIAHSDLARDMPGYRP